MTNLLKHWHVWTVILFLIFSACTKNEFYNEFAGIQNASWDKDHPLDFKVTITDTISSYDVFIEVRNNNDYSFRNVWLFIQFTNSQGNVRSDTLNCELADVYGKWLGKGGFLYTSEFPYEQNIHFPASGTCQYSVRQGMRENPLKGISDIGFRIVKHSEQ